VLDLADGRVLAAMDVPGLMPTSQDDPPRFEFDGERVLMRLRDVPGCASTAVRTSELDAARSQFRSRSECVSIDSGPSRTAAAPAWTELERQFSFRHHPLRDGALVWSHQVVRGTLFERRSSGGDRWQLFQPTPWNTSWFQSGACA
jgi:hypothetical protein